MPRRNLYRSERARERSRRRNSQRVVAILFLLLFFSSLVYFIFNRPDNSTLPAGLPQSDAEEIVTGTGLKYQDDVIGDGPAAQVGNTLVVHYTGWLLDGTKFDSSRDRNSPFTVTLGAGRVIAGWEEGLLGMKTGGKRILTIPPALGYGSRGAGTDIPPNATLIFEVEVLEIQ